MFTSYFENLKANKLNLKQRNSQRMTKWHEIYITKNMADA